MNALSLYLDETICGWIEVTKMAPKEIKEESRNVWEGTVKRPLQFNDWDLKIG